jgi:hypothetical protein
VNIGVVLGNVVSVRRRVCSVLAWSVGTTCLARIRSLVLLLVLLIHRSIQLLHLVILRVASVLMRLVTKVHLLLLLV